MIRRYGRKDALLSFIQPALFYLSIATLLLVLFHEALLDLKDGVLVGVAIFGIWRYGLLIVNYIRAALYANIIYPNYLKKIEAIKYEERFPDTIYFIIPSYKEDYWVTTEVFQSLVEEINSIPSKAVLVVSTASEEENSVIMNVINAHADTDKIKIIFQTQSMGKRIAMGHALRVVAREYNKKTEDENSVTLFMDGDTYLPSNTLSKALPFFKIDTKLGAVTTNETGYIESKSKWYKDWFNLKFAQRHLLFQSHSVSKRVLTLTGRFSLFRTTVVVREDFISIIENDIITDPNFGKFRFLMGDDKSSWFYMMKHNWNLLYLPDVIAYSLESRDGDFLEISRTLPYRWYGNTLRNNKRARALKNQPLFIKYLFYDQLALMWTSITGIVSVLFISLFKSVLYFPLYISWILYVRVFQMGVFALLGHSVSIRTLPLMLYGQWYGSYVKIKAFYNLSDQKWSKAGGEVQTADADTAPIKYKFASLYSPYRMYLFIGIFLFVIATFQTQTIKLPSMALLNWNYNNGNHIVFKAEVDDNKDDAKSLNELIKSVPDGSTIQLPRGVLDIYEPIIISRDNITIVGDQTILLSHMHNAQKAVIIVKGFKKNSIAKLQHLEGNKLYLKLKKTDHLSIGKYLLAETPNTKEFVQQQLGAQVWYKKYPVLRSEIFHIIDKEEGGAYIVEFASTTDLQKDATLFELQPLENIRLKNITIDSVYSAKGYEHDYTNRDKKLFIDGIFMYYVAKSHLENIKLYNSGSNPLVFERCYNCYGKDIEIDGAVNKGKKGNGYLRINKSFHIQLHNLYVKNIRHITFQWASAYNTIDTLYSEVDINFHGGASHDNSAENVTFNVNKAHKWGKVYRTPKNARWAPPDYTTNSVKEKN